MKGRLGERRQKLSRQRKKTTSWRKTSHGCRVFDRTNRRRQENRQQRVHDIGTEEKTTRRRVKTTRQNETTSCYCNTTAKINKEVERHDNSNMKTSARIRRKDMKGDQQDKIRWDRTASE